jgi:hypothetical protein
MNPEFGSNKSQHQLPYDTELNVNEKEDEIETDDEPEEIATDDDMSNEPETDKIEQLAQDKEETGEMLQGGIGDGKSPLEFDSDQVLKGMEVEIEHSDNPMISLEIVLDHLTEDPEYYTEKDSPEASAQFGAAKDGEGDKEKADVLLGFKPHNVGDDIEGDNETPKEVGIEAGEEANIEDKKEDELGESDETELKQNDPATWHQIQIAKKTIKMPDAMAAVMGGMTKEEAKRILTQRGLKFNENNDFTNNPLGAEKHYNDTNAYQKYQEYEQMDFNNLTDDQKEEFFQLWKQFKENR